jgi:iron complex outermembrane recepter protein
MPLHGDTERVDSMQKRKQPGLAIASTLSCLLLTGLAGAQDDRRDISQLSLDQLAQVQVTSVSKKAQKLEDTAAAIYVITASDIHNSTASSIPELLRRVPGLDVAQINGSHWAISARGFAEQYSDKMLVLIDGRSVFDPLFPGVYWNEQDLMLEDIERIEIIRGPGATLWGSNAVNGVINIITKPAQETAGPLITAGAGDKERSFGAVRYGGKLGSSAHYRIYSKYYDAGPSVALAGGLQAHDSARAVSGGFRLDASRAQRDFFTLTGKAFSGTAGLDSPTVSFTPPFTFSYVDFLAAGGENLMGSWTHESLNGQKTVVQTSYSHVLQPQLGVDVNGNSASASIQHERSLGSRHNLVMGLGYDFRSAHTSFTIPTVWWDPANSSYHTGSGFIQDEMLFANGSVRLTAGLRLERNTLSDLALQPNVRILWKITRVHSLWASYSLANEMASLDSAYVRGNQAVFLSPAGLGVARIVGNPNLEATKLNALEVGYRVQPSNRLSLDLATFYNKYTDLFGVEPGFPFFEAGPPPRIVQPLVIQNNNSLRSFGGEFGMKWLPVRNLQLSAAYSFIRLDAAAGQAMGLFQAGQTPRNKLTMDSHINLSHALSLNSLLSFVDRRPVGPVPAYTQLDSALVWRPASSVELSLGAKNLFNREHVEFKSQQGALPTLLGRSVFGKVTWQPAVR